MTSSEGAGTGGGSLVGRVVWPRWLMAVLVGVPAVGLGYYYLNSRRKHPKRPESGDEAASTDSTSPSVEVAPNVPHKEQTPLQRALVLKLDGNTLFKNGHFEDAIKCYSEAISICPDDKKEDLATFYQNRAATFECMNKMEKVLEDCSKAIELSPKYIKALNRRYRAAERLGNLQQSLEDITAICKELAEKDASKKAPVMPSRHFLKAYFKAYTQDPVTRNLTEQLKDVPADTPLSGLKAAKRALLDGRYDDIVQCCNEQLAMDTATGEVQSEEHYQALLLRASICFLQGESEAAMEDLDTIINEKPSAVDLVTTALVKRATLHLRIGNLEKCLEDFDRAQTLDPNNSDIFHNRGQVYLLTEKLTEAIADFENAVKYNPEFPLSTIHLCYTRYRKAASTNQKDEVVKATAAMREAVKKHSDITEALLLLGQETCEEKPAIAGYSQALLELQWHSVVEKAIEYLEKAIQVDNKCEFAFETFATVEVQRGNLKHGVELYDQALKLVRSENELRHLHALKAAAEAQLMVQSNQRHLNKDEHQTEVQQKKSLFSFYSGTASLGFLVESPVNASIITTLILVGQPLNSLRGIEVLPQLKELWAVECQLMDVTEVLACVSLVKLYLYSNSIEYFPALEGLKNLETLWLSKNFIERIYNVRQVPSLKELYIADNMISEISDSFENSINLEILNIAGNPIRSLHEVTNLQCLPALRTLMIHDPMFSTTPITCLCHYRPYVVHCLPQITSLDFFNIEEEEKELTKVYMSNKFRYYSMARQRAWGLHYKKLIDWAQGSRLEILSLRSKMYNSAKNQRKERGEAEQEQFESEIFQWDRKYENYNELENDGELTVALKQLNMELKFLGNVRFENHYQGSTLWDLTQNILQEFVCPFAKKFLRVVNVKLEQVTHVVSCIEDPLEEMSMMKNFSKYLDLRRSFLVAHRPVFVQNSSHWPSRYLDARFSLKEDEVGHFSATNCLALADSKWLSLHGIQKMVSKENNEAKRVAVIVYLSPSSKLKKEDIKEACSAHTNCLDGDLSCCLYTVENPLTATPKFIVQYRYIYQGKIPGDACLTPKAEGQSSENQRDVIKGRDKGISVLEGLNYSHWELVTHINLAKCRIAKFGPVGSYPLVKNLDVSYNLLGGLREVSTVFPRLVLLNAAFNRIPSTGPISDMKQLETLNLQWNRLGSLLNGLRWLRKYSPNLKSLDLRYNGILDVVRRQDVRYLAAFHLPSLKRINEDTLNGVNTKATCRLESIHDLQSVVELKATGGCPLRADWSGACCTAGPHVAVDEERRVVCIHIVRPESERPRQKSEHSSAPSEGTPAASVGAGENAPSHPTANVFHNFKCELPMDKMRWLTISGNQLHSVQFLLGAPNLEEIDLSRNTLQRIRPGGHPLNLISLVKLNISDNYLTSISDLREANLPSLQVLNVSRNLLASLEGVQGLGSLVELYAAANKITTVDNIASIRPWKSMKIIDVSHNSIDESPVFRKFILFHMPKIEYINGVSVKDSEQLSNCSGWGGCLDMDYLYKLHKQPCLHNLTELTLSRVAIRKINIDSQALPNIQSLNLEGNCLTSLSGLGHLEKLKQLSLSHNSVTHIGRDTGRHDRPLFPNLQILHLNANNIISLEPLELRRLPRLTTLFLQDNQIFSMYGLRHVKTLQYLVLDRNKIQMVQPHDVFELENLTELYLESNQIVDLEFLKSLGHLKKLFLANNRISENTQLARLRSLLNLNELTLINNPVCRSSTRWRVCKQILGHMPRIKLIDGLTVHASEKNAQRTNGSTSKKSANTPT
ncbi:hypothetical protein AAG570_006602 [Ranatra chinensis]|uniref:U2A'/phosphoprotein 32 family A C-terminal domain-containing protein n=1 Tax=Ranatra chinensis TaxID=642074 RepID=A0ABD0YUH0_9HEMI